MKKIVGIILVSALCLFAVLGCGPKEQSGEEKVVLRLGLEHEEHHPYGETMKRFADLVAEKTDGSVEIKIYASSQLGSANEMVEGLQLGTIDMVLTAVGFYKSFYPAIELGNIPFLLTSEEEYMEVLNGEVGEVFKQKLEENGLINLAFYWGGGRHFTNNSHPINTVEDLRGLKMRSIPTKISVLALEAFGAQPISMSFGDLYGALQTGAVDGQDNPLQQIYASGFYEVQKYLSLCNWISVALNLVISEQSFNKLTPAQQEAIRESAVEVIDWHSKNMAESEDELIGLLEEKGMIINEVEDIESFRAVVESLYDDYKSEINTPDFDWFIEECRKAKQ